MEDHKYDSWKRFIELESLTQIEYVYTKKIYVEM